MALVDEEHEERDELRLNRIVAAVIGAGCGLPMTAWAFAAGGPLAALVMLLIGVPVAVLVGMYGVGRLTR